MSEIVPQNAAGPVNTVVNAGESEGPKRITHVASRTTNFLMVAVIFLVGSLNVLVSEKVTINNGLGVDGLLYAQWTRDFYGTVILKGVNDYYVSRVLPSAIVHYGMKLVGATPTDRHIILAFDIYNLLLLVLSAWTWGLISDRLNLQATVRWFGWCCLFLNHALLKHSVYSPVLTDTTAFCLGLLMIYCFLMRRTGLLLTTIALGAFTWPTLPLMGAILSVFRWPEENRLVESSSTSTRRLARAAAAVISIVTLTGILYLLRGGTSEAIIQMSGVLWIDERFLLISIVCVVLYLFFALQYALVDERLFSPVTIWQSIAWNRVVAVAAVLGATQLIQHRIWNEEHLGWFSIKGFVAYTFLSALTEPFMFLLGHAIYFGPGILLVMIFWKEISITLREFGIGLRLVILFNVCLSINPQSRYQINAVGLFVVLLSCVMNRVKIDGRAVLLWATVSLVFSKVWYVMNTGPQVLDGTMATIHEFPLQHVFMSFGNWMSAPMYFLQGSVVLITGAVLWHVRKRYVLESSLPHGIDPATVYH